MTDDHVTVRDPTILAENDEENSVTIRTDDGQELILDEGTIVEGVGEHYFEGTIDTIVHDSTGDHHWVTFENVTLGDEGVSEHTLPLGELAEQIDENLTVH